MSRLSLTIFIITILFCSSSVSSEEKPGFELLALGCEISFPSGYSLDLKEGGILGGAYRYRDSDVNPGFFFSPNTTWKDTTKSVRWVVHSTETIGDFTFQSGKATNESGSLELDNVVFNDTGSFASPAKYGTQFVDQFKQCARNQITNR